MAQFKAGDKVRCGDETLTVTYGPFGLAGTSHDSYLVKRDTGYEYAASGSTLVPALEIGDQVTVDGLAGTFTLTAGPWTFPREAGGPQYVVTDAASNAYLEGVNLVRAVAALTDQSHAWRDRQGDIWYPLGEVEGEERYSMSADDHPGPYHYTMGDLRRDWGPLEADHSILEPTAEGATAIDAGGTPWYRHGADSDGVGRWSVYSPSFRFSCPLEALPTWRQICADWGPMRGAA